MRVHWQCFGNRAIALVAAVAVAGLLGCGSNGNSSNAVLYGDAGTTGGTDGGVTGGTDGGVSNDHTVGADCMPPNGMQGDCNAGELCIQFDAANNYCTAQCMTNTDCGMNGTVPNECFMAANQQPNQPGFCIRSCNPMVANSCNRLNWICVPPAQGSPANTPGTCLPDCRVPGNECSYGSMCDQTQGVCTFTPCQMTTPQCQMGQVCAMGLLSGNNVCVADCRMAGNTCPMGGTCDMTTGVCNIPQGGMQGGYYAQCGQGFSNCATGMICALQQGATAGVCLADCSMNQMCPTMPAGSQCAVAFTSGQKACAVACTPGTTGTTSACPMGTTCQTLGTSGSFCLP